MLATEIEVFRVTGTLEIMEVRRSLKNPGICPGFFHARIQTDPQLKGISS